MDYIWLLYARCFVGKFIGNQCIILWLPCIGKFLDEFGPKNRAKVFVMSVIWDVVSIKKLEDDYLGTFSSPLSDKSLFETIMTIDGSWQRLNLTRETSLSDNVVLDKYLGIFLSFRQVQSSLIPLRISFTLQRHITGLTEELKNAAVSAQLYKS